MDLKLDKATIEASLLVKVNKGVFTFKKVLSIMVIVMNTEILYKVKGRTILYSGISV